MARPKRLCFERQCQHRKPLSRLLVKCLVFSSLLATAQLVETPIAPAANFTKLRGSSARTQSLTPMRLPFWDDFSFRQEPDFPNDTLWLWGKTVWVNHGRAINPPSIYTATFDGINANGKPYNVNDVLAKGFADTLVSRPIKLDGLRPTQADSVYISFFYQVTGLAEAPDQDDNFSLWFRDENGNWENVFEVSNSVNLRVDSFYYAIVKVEDRFHHENFQFKFQNFSRLSGPYDIWNLDYVYLNSNRWSDDFWFPDRTQVQPFTSIFERYRAIPIKHFRDTAATVLARPTAIFGNLYGGQEKQTSAYYSHVTIESWVGETVAIDTFSLERKTSIDNGIYFKEFKSVTLTKAIDKDSINLIADSVAIKFKVWFDSGDDIIVGPPEFIAFISRFKPINFSLNDTTTADFILHKHYAYDDGTAEYGAGLNAVATEMAYSFPMFTKEIDTLNGVYIYFPEFGVAASQNLDLKIWSADSNGKPETVLLEQSIAVTRTQFNQFTYYPLNPGLLVQGKFLIGWQQNSVGLIAVGIDKNNDSGDDIYFNTKGTWEQNQNVRGSLMIRPVFGYVPELSVVSGVEKNHPPLYPNPAGREFYIPGRVNSISIFNMVGAELSYESEIQEARTRVHVQNPSKGLYLVRWIESGNIHTSRLLLLND